jgi:hypothetical protein
MSAAGKGGNSEHFSGKISQIMRREAEARRKERAELESLLRKKTETELFLSTLREAQHTGKFPEYSYDRLMKRSQRDLADINRKIAGMGYNRESLGGIPRGIAQPKEAGASLKENAGKKMDIEELAARVERLSSRVDELSKRVDERLDGPSRAGNGISDFQGFANSSWSAFYSRNRII